VLGLGNGEGPFKSFRKTKQSGALFLWLLADQKRGTFVLKSDLAKKTGTVADLKALNGSNKVSIVRKKLRQTEGSVDQQA